MKHRALYTAACAVIALLGLGTRVQARPFPTWDKLIDSPGRFKVVMDGAAALDKETGLVWELSPSDVPIIWSTVQSQCFSRFVGGRFGWRVPTAEELASLVTVIVGPSALPDGHPFVGVAGYYWSATTDTFSSINALAVSFTGASLGLFNKNATGIRPWCVRGR